MGEKMYNNQIIEMYNKYGKKNLNIKNKTMEEIFQNPFWRDLVDSWSKNDFREGRVFECAFTCGQTFTKCWDQGGSKR